MKSILKRYLSFGLWATLLAAGCTETDLDRREEVGHVEIRLTWVDDGGRVGKRFDFYPVEGGEPLTYLSDAPECNAGFEGFKGSLPSGDYRMIVSSYCESDETLHVEFRNEHSYDNAAFRVSRVATSRAGEVEGYSNRIEHVGCLMFTRQFDDGETLLTVPYQQTVKRTATPKSYVKHVKLNFRIENPDDITKCEGVFVGVAESVNCCTGVCSATTASVDFKANKAKANASDIGFTAELKVLDLIDPGQRTSGVHTVYLTLTKVDSNGVSSSLTTTIDVTAAVQNLIDINDGTLPLDIPLLVELKILGNVLTAEVAEWPEGTGSGEVVSSGTTTVE